jgi:hypothetical protein
MGVNRVTENLYSTSEALGISVCKANCEHVKRSEVVPLAKSQNNKIFFNDAKVDRYSKHRNEQIFQGYWY